jgi:hypothetical protein
MVIINQQPYQQCPLFQNSKRTNALWLCVMSHWSSNSWAFLSNSDVNFGTICNDTYKHDKIFESAKCGHWWGKGVWSFDETDNYDLGGGRRWRSDYNHTRRCALAITTPTSEAIDHAGARSTWPWGSILASNRRTSKNKSMQSKLRMNLKIE